MSKIAIVMSAYNEQKWVAHAFGKLKEGFNQFPEHEFGMYVADDGSTDLTPEKIMEHLVGSGLNIIAFRNIKNIGLVATLKKLYALALKDNPDVLIKTDFDDEYDQTRTIESFVPMIGMIEVALGMGKRHFTREDDAYVFDRVQDVSREVEEELGLIEFDAFLHLEANFIAETH